MAQETGRTCSSGPATEKSAVKFETMHINEMVLIIQIIDVKCDVNMIVCFHHDGTL